MNDELNKELNGETPEKSELNNSDESHLVDVENPFQTQREDDEAEHVANPGEKSAEPEKAVEPSSVIDGEKISEAEKEETAQEPSKKVVEETKVKFYTPAVTAEPTAKSKASKVINRIIMVIAILIFAVSATVLIKHFVDIEKSKAEAQKLAEMVAATDTSETTTEAVGADGILEKYREAYNTNNDLVGWIKVPNTAIDHPVVIGTDNNEYLRKSFYGVYDKRGTVFMDADDHVDELCKNTILYGHNYLDSTMFSDLEKYKDIEFYRQNPIIEFNTIYKSYKWKVVAVFLTNALDADDNGYTFNYIYPFMTEDNFEQYIDELFVRSLYHTAVSFDKTDKILTLSTCTRDMDIKGNGQTNARFVVIARLVRDGESLDVDTASAVINDNPRYPQIWYKAHGQTNPYINANRWYPEGVAY